MNRYLNKYNLKFCFTQIKSLTVAILA